MKLDTPETEAWRRKRAEELGVERPDPWYLAHPRNARETVAPMRTPVLPREPEPVSGLTSTIAARPPEPAISFRPTMPAPPAAATAAVAPRQTGVAIGSAVAGAMLLAVAAGWQARDLIDPPRRAAGPVRAPAATAPPVAVPAARAPVVAAPPRVEAPQCDAPAIADALRDRIATGVAAEGADARWNARVASEIGVTIARPDVTTRAADGTRFCGTTLTIDPPGRRSPLKAPVTYSIEADGALSGVQGDLGAVRRLAGMGRPLPVTVPVEAAKPTTPTPRRIVEKPVAAKTTAPPVAEREAKAEEKGPRVAAVVATTPPVTVAPPAPRRTEADDSVGQTCANVWSRAEAMICASPDLRRRHRQMIATLDRILLSGEAVPIKRAVGGQRRFLARRDNCNDADCITKRYDARLADLAKIEAKGNVK